MDETAHYQMLHSQNKFTAEEKTFTNELGNKITVRVREADSEDHDNPCKTLSVSMIGPTSMSENIITLKEARKLSSVLRKYLKQFETK